MRSFGMEEKFLLADTRTGKHALVGEKLLDNYLLSAPATQPAPSSRRNPHAKAVTPGNKRLGSKPAGNSLTTELQREQVEAVSVPFTLLNDLAEAIREGRAEDRPPSSAPGSLPWEPPCFPNCRTQQGRDAVWQ